MPAGSGSGGAGSSAAVSLRVSPELLRADAAVGGGGSDLWTTLERGLAESGIPWSAVRDEEHQMPGSESSFSSSFSSAPRWAYLESDFAYAPHRLTCSEGGQGGGREELFGTRYPLALIFEEDVAASFAASLALLPNFLDWLRSPLRSFGGSLRVTLVLIGGQKPVSLKKEHSERLALAMVRLGVGTVEVRDCAHAAQYVVQCAAAVAECKRRRVPSRFKVPGVRCQTLPKDPQDKLRLTWVSQLMQVAGVSEEIAKAVAGRYASPSALLLAVAESAAAAAGGSAADDQGGLRIEAPSMTEVADAFLADLEYPTRGKKGTRRLGPVVSRRLFTLFHADTPADTVLS